MKINLKLKNIRKLYKYYLALLLILSGVIIYPVKVFALDTLFYSQNDILFYKPDDVSSCGTPGSYTTSESSLTRNEFVDKYGQGAFEIGQKYGIPYEAMLAQGAIESGNGNSTLTTIYNNYFGIKASPGWQGAVVNLPTKEEENGVSVDKIASFRVYPDIRSGWEGYAKFIHENPIYSKALLYPTDYVRYLEEVANAGYATSSTYKEKTIGVANSIVTYISSTNKWPPSSSLNIEPVLDPLFSTSYAVDCTTQYGQGGTGGDAGSLNGEECLKSDGVTGCDKLVSGYSLKSTSPTMIFYNQYSDSWRNPSRNIYNGSYAECGCFAMSMAMAINTVGPNKNINPFDIGDVVKEKNGLPSEGCGYGGDDNWPVKNLQNIFSVKITKIESMSQAITSINNGGLVVVSMKAESPFTSGKHYIILRGITESGKVAVANPTDPNQSLTKTFDAKDLQSWRTLSTGKMWVVSAR